MTCKRIAAVIIVTIAAAFAISAPAQGSIAPASIKAAVAFWAPYATGGIPCTASDVHIYDTPATGVQSDALGYAYDKNPDGTPMAPHCDIYISRHVADDYGPPEQCDVIAHEWGHAWFGLDHSTDPNNIMYPTAMVTPGACWDAAPPPKSTVTWNTVPTHHHKRKARRHAHPTRHVR